MDNAVVANVHNTLGGFQLFSYFPAGDIGILSGGAILTVAALHDFPATHIFKLRHYIDSFFCGSLINNTAVKIPGPGYWLPRKYVNGPRFSDGRNRYPGKVPY